MSLLEEKVLETIEKYKMIEPRDKILVGVSGGPDSISLLYFLNSIKEKYEFEITACHLNHTLRKEADKEEEFVKDFCKKLGIKVYTDKKDVIRYKNEHKLSLEESARELRYLFFKNIAKKIKSNKLALAHNADDNVETVIMFLLRGCGKEGIKGISPIREEDIIIIRPFIEIFRREIEEYLRENKLSCCQDSSNLDKKFLRNKIRHNLIPYLQKYNPKVKKEILKFSEIEYAENQLLEKITEENYKNVLKEKNNKMIILDKKKFEKMPISLKRRILRYAIKDIKRNLKNVKFEQIDSIIDYISRKNNKKLLLPQSIYLKIKENEIIIIAKRIIDKNFYFYNFEVPDSLKIKEAGLTLKAEVLKSRKMDFKNKDRAYFDYEKVGGSLIVRNRREKDTFIPYGMGKKVKLKKFFINQKIPKEKREILPLVLKDKDIIWVAGLRTSNKFLVGKNTKKILEIKLIR